MIYVLDANAMIAVLNDEAGADIVEGLLTKDDTTAYAHAVNVCEVYYPILRVGSEMEAEEALADIRSLGVQTRTDMDEEFWKEVGRVKAHHRLSLADAFAIALTQRVGGELLTSDHHELDPLAAAGICQINFFR